MHEDTLRVSEANLAKAQEIAHIGSWEIDPRTLELAWSDEVYRIFGVRKGQFLPTHSSFLECVHPEDRKSVLRIIETPAKNAEEVTYIHRILRPDGEVRTVRQVALVHD